MPENTAGPGADPVDIDWRMSASLEDVPRGDDELAQVTSLERAVRAWAGLDPEMQDRARLTPERPIHVDGMEAAMFTGRGIAVLVRRLPAAPEG